MSNFYVGIFFKAQESCIVETYYDRTLTFTSSTKNLTSRRSSVISSTVINFSHSCVPRGKRFKNRSAISTANIRENVVRFIVVKTEAGMKLYL